MILETFISLRVNRRGIKVTEGFPDLWVFRICLLLKQRGFKDATSYLRVFEQNVHSDLDQIWKRLYCLSNHFCWYINMHLEFRNLFFMNPWTSSLVWYCLLLLSDISLSLMKARNQHISMVNKDHFTHGNKTLTFRSLCDIHWCLHSDRQSNPTIAVFVGCAHLRV